MNRSQKELLVTELAQQLQGASAAFLVNYQGSSVKTLHALRKQLRTRDSSLRVAKARILKLAVSTVPGGNNFAPMLKEQVGLVIAAGKDVSGVAKNLVDFAKGNETIKVVSGFYEAQVLSTEQVVYFASLPSREVLLGQFLGTLQAPIAHFVRLLNMLIVRLLYVLQRIAEQKQQAA